MWMRIGVLLHAANLVREKFDCSENGGYSVVVAGSKSTRKICLIISIVNYLFAALLS